MFNCLECTWNSETQDESCSGRVRSEVKSQVVKESGASEDWSGYLGSAAAVALWTSARVHAPQQLLLKPVLEDFKHWPHFRITYFGTAVQCAYGKWNKPRVSKMAVVIHFRFIGFFGLGDRLISILVVKIDILPFITAL